MIVVIGIVVVIVVVILVDEEELGLLGAPLGLVGEEDGLVDVPDDGVPEGRVDKPVFKGRVHYIFLG